MYVYMSVSACECIKYSPACVSLVHLGTLRPVPIVTGTAGAGVTKSWAGQSSFLLGCLLVPLLGLFPGVCKEGSGGAFYLKILQRVQVF